MDGWLTGQPPKQDTPVAFLSDRQAEAYGGFKRAAEVLRVSLIRSPTWFFEHHPNLVAFLDQDGWNGEVGHA